VSSHAARRVLIKVSFTLTTINDIVSFIFTSSASVIYTLSLHDALPISELTDYSLTSIRGRIELRDVTVMFDGVKALDRVSLVIEPGERVGLTGRTGSGKTLIARLIARMDDPDAGQVLIDGIDVRRYPIEVVRRYVAVVPQEPFLFSDTIAENIAYGVPEAPREEPMPRVRRAAELAQLAGDVEGFPEGYDTRLGE